MHLYILKYDKGPVKGMIVVAAHNEFNAVVLAKTVNTNYNHKSIVNTPVACTTLETETIISVVNT